MHMTIKKSNNIDERSIEAWFPIEEEKLNKICEDIGISTSKNANCYIVDSNDSDLISVIKERYCNVDELNFLVKRLDSFDAKEKNTFFASAVATDAQSLKELINLTYNTHCYSVVSDFSNLNAVGRDVYLNEVGAATTKELEAIDGRAVVDELMKFSPMKVVTPYGVLYQNRNEPEQVYDGRHFPCYYGYDMIKDSVSKREALIVLEHHEKCNGSGYPQGILKEDMLIESRILAVADAFDALTSDRAYRKALSVEEALSILEKDKGVLWDERVLDALNAVLIEM